jgi:hypothetical protein
MEKLQSLTIMLVSLNCANSVGTFELHDVASFNVHFVATYSYVFHYSIHVHLTYFHKIIYTPADVFQRFNFASDVIIDTT